jgi:hypothetical protein
MMWRWEKKMSNGGLVPLDGICGVENFRECFRNEAGGLLLLFLAQILYTTKTQLWLRAGLSLVGTQEF